MSNTQIPIEVNKILRACANCIAVVPERIEKALEKFDAEHEKPTLPESATTEEVRKHMTDQWYFSIGRNSAAMWAGRDELNQAKQLRKSLTYAVPTEYASLSIQDSGFVTRWLEAGASPSC